MSDKKIKYQVNRSMQDGAKSYARGDTREMTEAEAETLLRTGALSLPGEDPATPEPAVKHTFGAAPQHSPEGFTVANPDNAITMPERAPAPAKAAKPVKKAD